MPNKTRVVVFGSSGMLGRYVTAYMSKSNHIDVVPIDRAKLDVVKSLNLEQELGKIVHDCEYAINCIGVLKPSIEKTGVSNTIRINSKFPEMLSNVCDTHECNLIHICSDCVFSGNKGKYTEDDTCDAEDLYAISKREHPTNTMILRTSFVGEEVREDPRGLLQWVLSASPGTTIPGYTNCMWNGVTCLQLAKAIQCIIDNDTYKHGLYHIHSNQDVSKHDLCKMIRDIYELNITIEPVEASSISGSTIKQVLDRTLRSKHKLGIITPSIFNQIYEQRRFTF